MAIRCWGLEKRQTLVLLAFGLSMGILLALAVAETASSLLFGLRPDHPLTFAGATLLLAAVALLASFVPVRRASLVDPMAALRYE